MVLNMDRDISERTGSKPRKLHELLLYQTNFYRDIKHFEVDCTTS